MKYWFFDGNDVVGPFEPKELAARRGFAATSLVCPENFSEDQDSWKMAVSFPDFHFDPSEVISIPAPEPAQETDSFDQEMDTLLKERSPLGDLEETPSVESPSLEIPKKPAKPGPIEDYFNNIKGEDLGNILGIPDPNENSDMNLARALQTQFEKTNPPTDKEVQPIEDDPFDEFTPKEEPEELPEETAPVSAPANEKAAAAEPLKKAEPAPAAEPTPASIPMSKTAEEDLVLTVHGQPPASKEQPLQQTPAKQETSTAKPEQETLQTTSQLPVLGQPETQLPPLPEQKISSFASSPQFNQTPEPAPASDAEQKTISEAQSPQKEAPAKEDAQPEELVPASKQPEPADAAPVQAEVPATDTPPAEDPKEATVRHILEGKLDVTPTPEVLEPIKNVTVEPQVNHVRPRLKQTPEIQEFLNQTRNERIERERKNKKAMAALSVLIALLAVGAAAYINKTVMGASDPTPQAAAPQAQSVQPQEKSPADSSELLPDIPVPPPPQTITEPSQENKALSLVQNYRLPGNKGTIAAYLNQLYRPQLTQGYTASWSVEPLHKSTYIVKYRLTKTRMEPVVYIFQADVEAGKLTGALNNITLDLVGKIQ